MQVLGWMGHISILKAKDSGGQDGEYVPRQKALILTQTLILNNCSSHKEGGMPIGTFVPLTTTSRKQLFDMGIGYSFK